MKKLTWEEVAERAAKRAVKRLEKIKNQPHPALKRLEERFKEIEKKR